MLLFTRFWRFSAQLLNYSFCYFDQVIEEFKNIFGPELEAVTGDPKRIEEVLVRVGNLVKPLEDVS